ncbi:MAG: SHOCT domain-containing protein [Anaerolineae bacterium]
MYWGWDGFGSGGMLLMMLMMVLVWGGVLVVVGLGLWALLRARPGATKPRDTTDTALQTLQERYARGEITREQYEQMRRDLMF